MNKITLTINKRKLDFHFGLYFLGEALDELDLSIQEIGERMSKNPFMIVPKLMYLSARYGLSRENKDVDFTEFEFVDWIEKDGGFSHPNLTKFIDSFAKSLSKDVPKQESNGSKKK